MPSRTVTLNPAGMPLPVLQRLESIFRDVRVDALLRQLDLELVGHGLDAVDAPRGALRGEASRAGFVGPPRVQAAPEAKWLANCRTGQQAWASARELTERVD